MTVTASAEMGASSGLRYSLSVAVTFRIVDARGVQPWSATVGGDGGVVTGGELYRAARSMLRDSGTGVAHLRLVGIEDSDAPGAINEAATERLPLVRVRILDDSPPAPMPPTMCELIASSPRTRPVLAAMVAVAMGLSFLVATPCEGPVFLNVTDAEHVTAFTEVSFVQDWLPSDTERTGARGHSMFGRSLTTWTDGSAAVGATRCSETVAALTNYFCGLDVAMDENNTLIGGESMRILATGTSPRPWPRRSRIMRRWTGTSRHRGHRRGARC